MKNYVVVFLSVFLAELGDKTQLATLLFAMNPAASKLGVFAAAAGALAVSTFIAVGVGSWLSGWFPPERLRIVAGLGFVVIGGWMLLIRS